MKLCFGNRILLQITFHVMNLAQSRAVHIFIIFSFFIAYYMLLLHAIIEA